MLAYRRVSVNSRRLWFEEINNFAGLAGMQVHVGFFFGDDLFGDRVAIEAMQLPVSNSLIGAGLAFCYSHLVRAVSKSMALFIFAGAVWAAPPAGYYVGLDSKRGAALREALHEIINDHGTVPFTSSSERDTTACLMFLDQDSADPSYIRLFYAQRTEPKWTFGLSTGWSREHLWPNSYGIDSVGPAFSDLRNLRAEDASVNGARGNKYFDVSDVNAGSYRNPANPEALECSTDSNSWEPPSSLRGDIARALFYMAVRYTGDRFNEPRLVLTDWTNQVSSSTNLMGRLTMLLKWHEEDPVDDQERARDEMIFTSIQGNRNPFVDHPEWVRLAFWPEIMFTFDGTRVTVKWPAEYNAASFIYARSVLGSWSPSGPGRTLENGAFSGWFTVPPEPGEMGFFRLKSE